MIRVCAIRDSLVRFHERITVHSSFLCYSKKMVTLRLFAAYCQTIPLAVISPQEHQSMVQQSGAHEHISNEALIRLRTLCWECQSFSKCFPLSFHIHSALLIEYSATSASTLSSDKKTIAEVVLYSTVAKVVLYSKP